MTSCNALVYEAIQRVYRNAVVDRIRSGMQAAYPDDYEKRVTSAFKTWDDIVSAAARSAATGVVAHPHQDVFDYLDVSHFPLLLNNYFSVLTAVEGLPPEQANEMKRQVVSYAREIKTIRDPLSHPGTSDIGVFDALRAVDNASRALRALGLPEAAEKIEPLRAEVAAKASAPGVASGAPVTVGKPVRLLPRPGCLAGRADLLTGLHVRLTSGAGLRPRMVALCGLGGAGKTSVAVEYAHEHLDEVGLAWQFAAENPTVLAAEFSELAAQLGVQDVAGTRDPVAWVPLSPPTGAGGSIGTRLPTFRAEAADRARAAFMPGTTWPVNGYPPGSSRGYWDAPVPMPSLWSRHVSSGSLALAFPVPA
jgi:hypothetical protein